MDVAAYLERLAYQGPRTPELAVLRALQRAHLRHVPFENLDIALGRPLVLDEAALFAKVVRRRRGGFCYELNGLFAALLRALGFDVTALSARVLSDGQLGPEFDHMALLVQSPGAASERYLVDVGFGASFEEPLRLDVSEPQPQPVGVYRVSQSAGLWWMHELDADGQAVDGYAFSLTPRQLADYAPMCVWQQTAPESTFTRKRVCTRATPDGRLTYSGTGAANRLSLTRPSGREEITLTSPAQCAALLDEHFGLRLDADLAPWFMA